MSRTPDCHDSAGSSFIPPPSTYSFSPLNPFSSLSALRKEIMKTLKVIHAFWMAEQMRGNSYVMLIKGGGVDLDLSDAVSYAIIRGICLLNTYNCENLFSSSDDDSLFRDVSQRPKKKNSKIDKELSIKWNKPELVSLCLYPSPFPEDCFYEVVHLMKEFNRLIDKIVCEGGRWVIKNLEGVRESDPFIANHIDIFERVYVNAHEDYTNKEGEGMNDNVGVTYAFNAAASTASLKNSVCQKRNIKEDLRIYILRSDYMLDNTQNYYEINNNINENKNAECTCHHNNSFASPDQHSNYGNSFIFSHVAQQQNSQCAQNQMCQKLKIDSKKMHVTNCQNQCNCKINFRSDHSHSNHRLNNAFVSDSYKIKQVEINTISASFGCLSDKISDLHRLLIRRIIRLLYTSYSKNKCIPFQDISKFFIDFVCPPNNSTNKFVEAIATCHFAYLKKYCNDDCTKNILMRMRNKSETQNIHEKNEKCGKEEKGNLTQSKQCDNEAFTPDSTHCSPLFCLTSKCENVCVSSSKIPTSDIVETGVLMIKTNDEENEIDQRHIQFELEEKYGIRMIRLTIDEVVDMWTEGRICLLPHDALQNSYAESYSNKQGKADDSAGNTRKPRLSITMTSCLGSAFCSSSCPLYGGKKGKLLLSFPSNKPKRDSLSKIVLPNRFIYEVSVVYFRSLYSPSQFKTADSWKMREFIEWSDAAKLPSIPAILAGSKKIQQILSNEAELCKFIKDQNILKRIMKLFTFQVDTSSPCNNNILNHAISNPHAYVLKPQREGGGNNLYGHTLSRILKTAEKGQLQQYVLMKKLFPPATAALFVSLKNNSNELLKQAVNIISDSYTRRDMNDKFYLLHDNNKSLNDDNSHHHDNKSNLDCACLNKQKRKIPAPIQNFAPTSANSPSRKTTMLSTNTHDSSIFLHSNFQHLLNSSSTCHLPKAKISPPFPPSDTIVTGISSSVPSSLPTPQQDYNDKITMTMQPCESELGVYGCAVYDGKHELLCVNAGHVLRSKILGQNEGGVMLGSGALDSPLLVDSYCDIYSDLFK